MFWRLYPKRNEPINNKTHRIIGYKQALLDWIANEQKVGPVGSHQENPSVFLRTCEACFTAAAPSLWPCVNELLCHAACQRETKASTSWMIYGLLSSYGFISNGSAIDFKRTMRSDWGHVQEASYTWPWIVCFVIFLIFIVPQDMHACWADCVWLPFLLAYGQTRFCSSSQWRKCQELSRHIDLDRPRMSSGPWHDWPSW